MKRIFTLLILALVMSTGLFAEESVLIDFNTLTADYSTHPDGYLNQNLQTLVDFGIAAGSGYTAEELARMKTSLFIENWEVELNSSAQTVFNVENSYTRATQVNQNAVRYAGETVMGVRVHFPNSAYNAVATVKPPFEIPAYMDLTEVGTVTNPLSGVEYEGLITPADAVGLGEKFNGFGVLKNVGVINSIKMVVYGLNFPHGVALVFKDQNNVESEYFMGYMNFDGWKDLSWKNPNYLTDVRNREINNLPLYPNAAPMIKLDSLKFYKDAAMEGGDFIAYVKDIRVIYDKAQLNLDRDISDEQIWGILQNREESRRNAEVQRLGNLQVLRYLEGSKMDNLRELPSVQEQAEAGEGQ